MSNLPLIGGAPELGYAPGVLQEIPEAEYHALPRLSKSLISGYRSPRHLALDMARPHERKEAFDQGTAFHVLNLEPELFFEKVAIRPECDRRSNDNKKIHALFEADNMDKAWITQEYYDSIKTMRAGMLANPEVAKYLLAPGRTEQSLFWADRYGLPWKMRADKVAVIDDQFCLIDLKKTAKGADAKSFAKVIADFQYHWQDYLYKEGWLANFGMVPRFIFIACEDFAPFQAQVFEIDTSGTAAAQAKIEPIREELARLWPVPREEWPGYPAKTNAISVPVWA